MLFSVLQYHSAQYRVALKHKIIYLNEKNCTFTVQIMYFKYLILYIAT